MNAFVEGLNEVGVAWVEWAAAAGVQSGLLILVVTGVSVGLRSRVSPAVIHALWALVWVKLLLPPSFALPTGVGYWLPRLEAVFGTTWQGVEPVSKGAATSGGSLEVRFLDGGLESARGRQEATVGSVGWKAWLATVGVAGSVGMLGWVGRAGLRMRRVIRSASPAGREWQETAGECAAALGVRRIPEVLKLPRLRAPAVCGWRRPVILIPERLEAGLEPEARRDVVLHEMAHVRNGDLGWGTLEVLVLAVYWWHPLVWVARVCRQRWREAIADAVVVSEGRRDAGSYAETLLAVAKAAMGRPMLGIGMLGILESRRALRGRVEALLNDEGPRVPRLGWRGLVGVILLGLVTLPMGGKARPVGAEGTRSDPVVSGEASRSTPPVAVQEQVKVPTEARWVAVGFGGERTPPTNWVMRSYAIQVGQLVSGIEARLGRRLDDHVGAWTAGLAEVLRAAGISQDPPEVSVTLDIRGGRVVVASEPSVEGKVKSVLEALTAVPPQILIEARFVATSDPRLAFLGTLTAQDSLPLRPARFREIWKQVETWVPEKDRGPRPRVVTLSGRAATITVGLWEEVGPGKAEPQANQVASRLEVEPVMAKDGTNIVTKLRAMQLVNLETLQNGETPIASVRAKGVLWVSAEPRLRSGESVVMKLAGAADAFVSEAREARYVFVTVTVIDPAGNPIGVVEGE